MSRKLMLVAGVLAALRIGPVLAGEAAPPSSQSIVLRRCEIEYKRSSLIGVAHMGTTTTSILQDCLVRRGDRVKAGQVLGRVMDRDIRAELDLRTAEADNLLAVHINQAKAGMAAEQAEANPEASESQYPLRSRRGEGQSGTGNEHGQPRDRGEPI